MRRAFSVERCIDAGGDFLLIGIGGQFLGLGDAEQRLALDIGAHNDRARHRLEPRRDCPREHGLAGAGKAADGDEFRRRRRDRLEGQGEVAARRARNRRPLRGRRKLHARGSDLGADRRAHRQKERQRSKRVEVVGAPRLGKIAVEHDARRPRESALEEVHQQEGEVIEDVARRDDVAEFDGVEEHRSAIDQDDIAEMKIAVDAADQARGGRAR